jgi:crotonobetaine/carnitine-CoA ligase
MYTPTVDSSQMTLFGLLRANAVADGHAVFLKSEDGDVTYQGVDDVVGEFAGGLLAVGVAPGTTVALLLDNSLDYVYLFFAINRLGAICVPINTAYTGEFLRHALSQTHAKVMVLDDKYAARLHDLDDLPFLEIVIIRNPTEAVLPAAQNSWRFSDWPDLRRAGSAPSSEAGRPEDVSMIVFTSGTTGPAKGAAHTNMAWYQAATETNERRDVREDDVFHVALPLFHAGAWAIGVFSALVTGLPVAIDTHFSVSEFWDRIRRFGATQLLTTSAMHMWLLEAPERPDDAANPARVWAPVPLDASLHDRMKSRFGIEHLWFTYGQTEVLLISSTIAGHPYKHGSAGWARPSLEVAAVDDDGNLVGPDVAGELVVRPKRPHGVMVGYWNDDSATVRATKGLWYHTGDTGRVDADGEIFFIDRRADYMRVRGENVSAFEVESCACEHPDVVEAAAYAIPAGLSAEDDIMLVAIKSEPSDLSEGELARFCAERLPRFAVPRYIEFVANLPHTPTNRVMKYQLRERGVTEATWTRPDSRFRTPR